MHVVVIGAGVGGLTAAALLVRAGHAVTVLEAHVYPGGCAGTFYHQGFRFDAGATLAGGFAPGGPHARVAELLGLEWPVHPVDPAWVVHLPGQTVTQWADPARWQEERRAAFPGTDHFWQTQEQLAATAWDLAARHFPWPPQSARELAALVAALRPRTLSAAPYALRTVRDLIPAGNPAFKSFLDAQLLIAAQTVSDDANALYGCAALDLPRRGVNHVRGGIGSLARTLADWIRAQGGQVLYRQTVEAIEIRRGRAVAVRTNRGLRLACDALLANLTPWGLAALLGDDAPAGLRREVATRPATWGAFTLYLGLDASRLDAGPPAGRPTGLPAGLPTGLSAGLSTGLPTGLPASLPDHHQVVVDPTQPLGETNSIFISLSDPGDPDRAPAGMRAATLSTHTAIAPWLQLRDSDEAAYLARRAEYVEHMLAAAERAVPGIRDAVTLCLPGTPSTFAFFTRRPRGMVGGFAQTSLLAARGPGTGLANAWLVGDSIFPGQSTAGVTLGGLRVAAAVMQAGLDRAR